MPLCMIQASYTAESWKAQMDNPQDLTVHLRGLIEAAGGRLLSFYYAFGEYDAVLIAEAPDNVTIASVLIAAAGGGATSTIKTTVLVSSEDGQEAIQRAKDVAYTPPS